MISFSLAPTLATQQMTAVRWVLFIAQSKKRAVSRSLLVTKVTNHNPLTIYKTAAGPAWSKMNLEKIRTCTYELFLN